MATLTDREYDAELHRLHDQLLLMGAKVEEMIANSMRSLTERDSELARRMIDYDHQINRLEVEIDDLCLRILAKRQPVASDLRLITTALKLVTDLDCRAAPRRRCGARGDIRATAILDGGAGRASDRGNAQHSERHDQRRAFHSGKHRGPDYRRDHRI